MGFYITDQTRNRGPRAVEPPWGPKPSRGPIREVISGYRFYNPDLGRWINRDPIGEKGGVNLSLFLSNKAIDTIDINGLCAPQPRKKPAPVRKKKLEEELRELAEGGIIAIATRDRKLAKLRKKYGDLPGAIEAIDTVQKGIEGDLDRHGVGPR